MIDPCVCVHLWLLPFKDNSVVHATGLALGGEPLRGEGDRATGLVSSSVKLAGERASVLFCRSYSQGDGRLNCPNLPHPR